MKYIKTIISAAFATIAAAQPTLQYRETEGLAQKLGNTLAQLETQLDESEYTFAEVIGKMKFGFKYYADIEEENEESKMSIENFVELVNRYGFMDYTKENLNDYCKNLDGCSEDTICYMYADEFNMPREYKWGVTCLDQFSEFESEEKRAINFDQFITALARIADDRNEKRLPEKTTFVDLAIWMADIEVNPVKSITYKHTLQASTTGGIRGGFRAKNVTTSEGRSSQEKIEVGVLAKVKIGHELIQNVYGIGYDFSTATESAEYTQTTVTDTFLMYFDKPMYVYQRSVRITYADNTSVDIVAGLHVASKPEPMTKTIYFNEGDEPTVG